ncbi:phenolic acid decarboxylase [Roseomonas frigidaquae]|uniref:Phenolic acid decarboxylase n=1 Tax=Falsiroseomonas frigidaquae TaxID=487318 RepID=A0ABX1EW68_9PROT|nr:phenolic acid decarboxylase [Falsiroseomonas frigidaquae]NKE43895.1 phenolic acid decarboxylase [Falsiroseomonas frigidaquae]
MSDPLASTRPAEIAPFVGKHYIYTYDNGWQYEFYIKNERRIEYRVHSGIVGGRWVKDQEAHIVRIADGVFKVSWVEPTGTCVSVAVNLDERRVHGATFFPRWVVDGPQKIVCFQNPQIELMQRYRDAGPTYPTELVDEFADITFIENCARDDETVIACGPEALPIGYTARRN